MKTRILYRDPNLTQEEAEDIERRIRENEEARSKVEQNVKPPFWDDPMTPEDAEKFLHEYDAKGNLIRD